MIKKRTRERAEYYERIKGRLREIQYQGEAVE
jgi:hypothetical protein